MIVWIDKTLVLAIHDRQLADLAATLAYGLARKHPFVDGNKRTAHVAYRTFLALNADEFGASDEEKYVTMLVLAEGKLSERQFAAWLRERLQPAAHGRRMSRRRRTERSGVPRAAQA